MVKRSPWFFVVLALSIPLWLGCGGGGSGGGGGNGGNGGGGGGGGQAGLGSLVVKATFPTGFAGANAPMKVSGGLFADVPLASGSATISSWTNARQLVAVLGASDTPILMGFVGPGHATLNARTTADAMTYLAIGGYLAPTENQALLLEKIEQRTEVDSLRTAIETDLKASPAGLVSPGATFRQQLTSVTNLFLGQAPGKIQRIAHAGKVAISPFPTAKSGVTVDYGSDVHQIIAHNTFRRRGLMFVDRISDIDNNGNEKPDFSHLQTVEIAPAKGTVYGNDLYGNLGNVLAQTDTAPVTLPDVPAGLSNVKYTVVVAGPGVSAGDSYTLSSSEQAELKKALKKTFFVDFLLPALGRVLVQNTLDRTSVTQQRLLLDEMVENASAQQDSIAAFVDQYFPNAEAKVEAGDFQGALKDTISGIWASDAATAAIAKFFATFMSQIPDFPGKADPSHFTKVLAWVNKAIAMNSASDVVYGLIDDLPQGRDFANSAKMQTWDVKVDQAKLTFTPQNSTINSSGTNTFVKLIATVKNITLQTGQKLTYKFMSPAAHGSLSLVGGGGQSTISTDQNYIFYSSNVGIQATYGTDPVTVEAYLDHGGGNLEKIGAGKASVKVEAQSDITLIPTPISVHPNESTPSIIAKTHYPDLISSGELQLKWSVKGTLGKLNVASTAGSDTTAVFTAGPNEGNETVQCDIIEKASGKTLSSATAQIKIEKKTSIVFGHLYTVFHQQYKDGWCTSGGGIGVRIPKVAGAKFYSVHCYNFYDGAYFGSSFDASCDAAGNGAGFDTAPDGTDLTTKGALGYFNFGMTGGAGFGPGPCGDEKAAYEGLQQSANGRFGGIIVQVTVTY